MSTEREMVENFVRELFGAQPGRVRAFADGRAGRPLAPSRYKLPAGNRAEIAHYLKPLGKEGCDLSIKQLEETIGLSLLLIVELAPADLNGSAELKRVAEAQRALQIFSRELFRAPPDKAREFADGLAGLSWWDKDDGDRIDRHLALWIRRLSARIGLHRDYLTLAHKYITFGRGVEHRAIGLIAEFGCRLYWRVHGNVPAPRKTGNQPGGPFDKFMYAMLEPIAGKMRKNGRRYGWPTIMKHVERARRNLRPSQSA